jgi:esterase/lipase superfamily enzyme
VDGYPADEDTVQLAVPKLVEFLSSLRTKAEVTEFHIVGHSMGCRALLGALRDTSWWNTVESPVAEAVFAAPDVDATVFRETISAMKNGARRYTLYGSERDWALAVSRSIRKNHPRAGDGGARVLVVQGVETVDATAAGEHLFGLGHSYVADKRTILGDLWAVLRGHPVPRFGLEARSHMLGKYWALLP